ncbi:hypothetical protein EYF80_046074 [Liparis tanakae]|uniref:Uncharacterized protein n=1 Tax=Liparis tanakae TaxID=230148 RepID=A0A4Z2FRE5_9TELE|nr:hypothetical protein EYF80_046074 [Liparis tanakae]
MDMMRQKRGSGERPERELGTGAVVLSRVAVTSRRPVGGGGGRGLGDVSLAAARRAVRLMEAAVGRQRVVEPRHAAVEAARLGGPISQRVAPEKEGEDEV